MSRSRLVTVALTIAMAVVLALPALARAADPYPTKPIKMIVAFSAGGATDVIARIVSQKLSESLGQSVVVDNRPGATGIIGTDIVAKSPADGYTLLMVTAGTHAINASLFKDLPYDLVKAFVHINFLIEFDNKLKVMTQWGWNYLTRRQGARLITGEAAPVWMQLPVAHHAPVEKAEVE